MTSTQATLDGRVAVVTGAAQGMGAAISKRLAAAGAEVFVADVNLAGAESVAEAIRESDGVAQSVRHDVTSPESWRSLEKQLRARGGLHIMVNNAAVFEYRSIEDTDLEQWHRLCRVNLDGVFLGCQMAIRVMKETPRLDNTLHSIVNLASIASFVGAAYASAYHMSKGGVLQFSKSVALETALLNYPIRCNTVHPGLTETPMQAGLFEARAKIGDMGNATEVKEAFRKTYPLGRYAEPSDVANAVAFLAGPESDYLTGSEIKVDGGFTAR